MLREVNVGYYRRTVYYDKPLKFCPYGSCGMVNLGEGSIGLKSYDTIVLELYDGYIMCTGTYSNTTRKHIIAFLREYAPTMSYSDMAEIAGKPYCIRVEDRTWHNLTKMYFDIN